MSVTPGWLSPHPNPAVPRFRLPPGAVDAHVHVFGPADRFPYAEERRYTPTDAPREALFALRDHLGFERNVIVQATCHGTDNRALVDALLHSDGRSRGVVTLTPGVTDDALHELHRAGVRGARFTFVRRLGEFAPIVDLERIARRIAPLGWNAEVYFEAADLDELKDTFGALPTTVVVDHLAIPDVTKPVDGPEFDRFMAFMADRPNIWTKVSCPERVSKAGPRALDGEAAPYRDVVPFARRVVEAFPDRVLFGTDWPHPNLKDHMPDDGLLVDYVQQVAVTEDLQRRLLVDNPQHLYWETQA